MSATPTQLYWWRVSLELKLRKLNGDAFQNFFCTIMDRVHGDDFVRVRPFGKLGDKGCDGYLQSLGQVFQCYGALDGGSDGKVAYLIKKMGDDYAKALGGVAAIMKEWHMVHNFVDGLPVEAVTKLEELRRADQTRKFGFVAMEGLAERVFALELAVIEELLGPAATSHDAQNLQPTELRDLIAAVAKAAEEVRASVDPIRPVPVEKLKFNNLPGHWHSLISGGWQNAHLVSSYLNRHPDPLVGEKLAQLFRDRYRYLKSQHLAPSAIMSELYYTVTGVGHVTAQRQVASQALLAYLFESCDIFEDTPAVTHS